MEAFGLKMKERQFEEIVTRDLLSIKWKLMATLLCEHF